VLDERVAYLITDILSDNYARAPAFGENSALNLTRPAAVKTGTTTDWRDNWTVGYTPDLVVGVWAGNADNEPMRNVTGVTGAAPIWHDVMETLLKGRPVREFVEPPGMVRVEVCADSGLLPVEGSGVRDQGSGVRDQGSGIKDQGSGTRAVRCPYTVRELFVEGTQPTRVDDWHWEYRLDARNGLLAGSDCPPEYTVVERFTRYPAEAADWVRWQEIPQPPTAYSPLCPAPEAGIGDQGSGIEGQSPDSQALIPNRLLLTSPAPTPRSRLSPAVPASAQRLLVPAPPADGVALAQVTLLVNGEPLATLTAPPYQAFWPMTVGRHTFTAVGIDSGGNEAKGNSIAIEVTE
jgi:membrane carboxypeptidase/penicillin-binding protein PbpC